MEGVRHARLLGVCGVVTAVVVALATLVASSVAAFDDDDSDKLTEVSAQKEVGYPDPVTVTAKCGHGQHVGFGGWSIDNVFPLGSGPSGWAFDMEPMGGKLNKWAVTAYNRFAPSTATLTSWGYCFKGDKPKVKSQSVSIEGSTNPEIVSAGEATATCPKKTTLIGGGWSVPDLPINNDGVVAVTHFLRTGKRAMSVGASNEKEVAIELRVFAICGKGKKPAAVEKELVLAPFEVKSAVANCPKGKEVVFGGFKADYDATEGIAAFVNGMRRNGKRKVAVSAGNPGLQADDLSTVTAVAYCR